MTTAALLIALIATPGAETSHTPVLLDFHAEWCGPCQQMRPAVELLTKKGYPVKSIDIDAAPKLAARYQVTAVPTFVVVDGSGRELDRTEGYQPAAQLASFYRSARQKAQPAADPDADAPASDHEADPAPAREPEAEREAPARPRFANPRPWETVVRIKVQGNGSIGFGSGTIIHSTPDESIILTCAHIFKLEGQRQAHPSQFPRRIGIDLFDGKLRGTSPGQVRYVESVEGEAIDYDFTRDVGLIRIRPGRRLPASRVVPASWVPQTQMRMTAVGCPQGQDATAWSTSIVHPTIRGLSGSPSYEAIECTTAPIQGRSGGGLYTLEGYVAGVCDFAEPRGNHGLYATPRSIHYLLDRNRMTAYYAPPADRGGPLLASNRPNSRRTPARSIARAQSPDREESGSVMIPSPELLGIKTPQLARASSRSTADRHRWRASKPEGPEVEPSEETRATDIALSPDVDADRFASVPAADPPRDREVEAKPARRPHWRPVRSASPAPSGADGR